MVNMLGFLYEWLPVFLMVAINFALAIANVLFKKVVDEGMNHLVLITYRTSISAVFLAPMAYMWERKTRPKLTSGILWYLFFSALLGATLAQYLFLLGMQYTSATFSCAFVNLLPAITFIMALPLRLETVNIRSKTGSAKVLGTIICVGGAMLLTIYKGMPLIKFSHSTEEETIHITNHIDWFNPSKKTDRWVVGCIALVAGIISWSSWFLIQARISKRYPCQYTSTTIMSFFAAIQSVFLSVISNRDGSLWVLHGRIRILTVLYAGAVGSGLCYVGMAYCVKKRGPLFTAAFSPLMQIVVAMFDFTILREQLHLGSVLGSIIVVAGLYILLWGKSKEAQEEDEALVQACVTKQAHETEDCEEEDEQSVQANLTKQAQETRDYDEEENQVRVRACVTTEAQENEVHDVEDQARVRV